MADAAFFGLFGLDVPPDKIAVFNQLVSLFDSLHDFGAFGSVYDYVTQSDGVFNTVRKTIFNHLRNGYPLLKDKTIISTTNSQLHSYSNNFHLKASLSKAKLEGEFYEYAKGLMGRDKTTLVSDKDNLTIGDLKRIFGETIIFSVDTQKKLFSSTPVTGKQTYQVFDREKQCDPASHTKLAGGNIGLLIEKIVKGSSRIYDNNKVPGVTEAKVSGDTIETTRLFISLPNLADASGVLIDKLGSAHPNNVTNVNNQLKALILGGRPEDMPDNSNTEPNMGFYNIKEIKEYASDANNVKKYILDVRRKLAQKRLGDQLQVLACKEGISYNDGVTVTNPIFVSIDRMAIAFAIANGVNCMYSNKDSLTLFEGSAKTVVTGALPQIGGELNTPMKNQMGGVREDWDILEEELKKSAIHIMYIFMYTHGTNNLTAAESKNFLAHVSLCNTVSIDCNNSADDIYVVRSLNNANPDIDATNSMVYLVNGGIKWNITKDPSNFNLLCNGVNRGYIRTEDLLGRVKGFTNSIEGGGGQNKEFLKTLAQYDLLTLCDEEQTKIWYDEFYTKENGFIFHSPTFYELNAFFQVVFEEDIDYMLIFPFLKNSSDPFSKDVLYAIQRIIDYMEISVDYTGKIDKASEAILLGVLERASEKSKEYGVSISSLTGSKLLDYLFINNLTPLYFYNVFVEKYPVKSSSYSPRLAKASKRGMRHPSRKMVSVYSGGKRRKDSPRRKTLRKTRRHR